MIPLGTVYRLREPRADVTHVTVDREGVSHEHVVNYPYNLTVVTGIFSLSPDQGGDEVILSPLSSHGTPLSVAANQITAAGWDLDEDATRSLAEAKAVAVAPAASTEAQPPWSTPVEELAA